MVDGNEVQKEVQFDGQAKSSSSKDGGWGWIIVMSTFMINFVADGILFSSGLVLSELVKTTGQPAGKIAWIFSMTDALILFSGPVASALVNRFGHRAVIMTGAFVGLVGLSSSSLVYSVDVLFVTIGLVCGLANGLLFLPSVIGVGLYFEKRRALATGIAVCGSGLGTSAFAPFIAWLLETYSLSGTFLIMGAVFFNCAVFGALFRPIESVTKLVVEEALLGLETVNEDDESKLKTSKALKLSLYRSPSLILISISSFFQSMGWFVPYMYLAAHANQMGISKEMAAFLLSIVGICGTCGRIMLGWLIDLPKVNVLLVNNITLTIAGVWFVICPLFTTYEWLVFYCVFLGLALSCTSGTRAILLGTLLGVDNVSDAYGFVLVFYGGGNLIGVPLAGWLFDIFGDYQNSFYIAGFWVIVSAVLCYPLGFINRWERKRKLGPWN